MTDAEVDEPRIAFLFLAGAATMHNGLLQVQDGLPGYMTESSVPVIVELSAVVIFDSTGWAPGNVQPMKFKVSGPDGRIGVVEVPDELSFRPEAPGPWSFFALPIRFQAQLFGVHRVTVEFDERTDAAAYDLDVRQG